MKDLKKYSVHFVLMLMIMTSKFVFAQLVTNGSFENSKVGVITGTDAKGWLIQSSDTISHKPVFEIESDNVQDGSKALKVTLTGIGASQWDIQIVADSIPAKQGETYKFSIWAKSSKAGSQVNFTVGNYSYSEYKAIRPATLTTTWQRFTMQFTVSDDQTYIRAPIHLSYAANSGNTIYIDNLQIADVNTLKSPIIVQAESGTLGSNYSALQDNNVKYITPKVNWAGLTSPGDTSRMATYQVVFPDSGSYNLFAHVRVGSGGFNDDSFFYGNGLGVQNDTASVDWIFVNGLASAGFTDSTAIVDGLGSVGTGTWKWVNISKNTYSGVTGSTFFVPGNKLTQTFQIGSREDGLDIDKFAFGKSYLFYSVASLDNDLPGATSLKGVDSTLIWKGPAIAKGQGKFIGNAYGDVTDNLFAKYWTQLTPGNAGKWGSIAGSADSTTWNWTGLDAIYKYATLNHLIFKDHNLIWGAQQPSWISTGLTNDQQAAYIESWIRQVGKRYSKIDMIDVVNEPLPGHNPPDGGSGRANYKNAIGGNGTTGYDWVIWAFQKARQYLPNTKLLINDYGIINDNSATTSYLQIINLLKDRGLIDGIGVQGHRFELESADTNVLKSNLTKLAATGLPIYISEFDLGNLNNSGNPDDAQQLQLYKKIFPILWKHPGVKGITLWGYLQDQMWQATCFVVNSDGTSRPALQWLIQYIKANPTDVKNEVSGIPNDFELLQNYPNPFNPTTTINYNIAKETNVKLDVFDVLGRHVQTLVNQKQTPGKYNVEFNASKLTSGVYIYRLQAGSYFFVKKLLLMK